MTLNCYNTIVKLILTALIPFGSFRIRGDRKLSIFPLCINYMSFFASNVSRNFAEFLLDSAVNGNEILSVLDDLVEVEETAL